MTIIPDLLTKLLRRLTRRTSLEPPAQFPVPTETEWMIARERLEHAAQLSVFGELAGIRPDNTKDRYTSWWGGNFLGLKGEGIPRCSHSGRDMLPVFQVRIDELPIVPEFLNGAALMSLWIDPESEHVWEATNGTGFMIRTYETLDGLTPAGHGYRQHHTMPTFPIRWHAHDCDLPDWEDFVEEIPHSVARHSDSDWFFKHPAVAAREALQRTIPIKLGGYAQWWQSPQDVDDGQFGFFLDSTTRGSLGLPAGGSANFFHGTNGWEMRVDCP